MAWTEEPVCPACMASVALVGRRLPQALSWRIVPHENLGLIRFLTVFTSRRIYAENKLFGRRRGDCCMVCGGFVVVQPSLVRQGVDGAERHKPRRHGRGETAGSEDNRRVCSGLCRRLRASALCRASWRRRLEGC